MPLHRILRYLKDIFNVNKRGITLEIADKVRS